MFGIKGDRYSYLFFLFFFFNLKGKVHPKINSSHRLLTPMSIESQVKLQNISKASM